MNICIRYNNLGDLNESPQENSSNIILKDGFYNGHSVSSIIEFECSTKINVNIVN